MNPIKEFFNEVETKVLAQGTDVISMIKSDHRKVDGLFQQYQSSSDETEKKELVKTICTELRVHAGAEETKVYPTLDQEDHNGANESLEEHHLIKILISELSGMGAVNDKMDAKMKVLSEIVKHHVHEEETKYLPELNDSGEDLDQMGEAFQAEKERLMNAPDQEEKPGNKAKRRSVAKVASAKKGEPRKKAKSAKKDAAKKAPAKKGIMKKAVAKAATEMKAAKKTVTKITAAVKKASKDVVVKTASKIVPAKKASKAAATKKASKAVPAKRASKAVPAKKASKAGAAKKASPKKAGAKSKSSTAKKPVARKKAA
jgi:hemerythrin superfamily protein